MKGHTCRSLGDEKRKWMFPGTGARQRIMFPRILHRLCQIMLYVPDSTSCATLDLVSGATRVAGDILSAFAIAQAENLKSWIS